MATRNDITGDTLSSKKNSDKFRSGWDVIWGDKIDDEEKEDENEKQLDRDGE